MDYFCKDYRVAPPSVLNLFVSGIITCWVWTGYDNSNIPKLMSKVGRVGLDIRPGRIISMLFDTKDEIVGYPAGWFQYLVTGSIFSQTRYPAQP